MHEPASEATKLLPGEPSQPQNCRGCCATPSLRVLWPFAIGFGAFSICEWWGASTSHSLELGIDAASMSIDASTYAINILAESFSRRVWRTGAVCWSITALTGVAIWVAVDASRRLGAPPAEADVDVDQNVLLGFSCANLGIDIVMIGLFVYRNRLELGASAANGSGSGSGSGSGGGSGTSSSSSGGGSGEVADQDQPQVSVQASRGPFGSISLNVLSAFCHVATDTLRTATSIICWAILFTNESKQSGDVDAYGAIVVSVITFLVVAFLSFELHHELKEEKREAAALSPAGEPARAAQAEAPSDELSGP